MWYYCIMSKHNRLSGSQTGAVSMITVLFVTMILTVMVLGFVRIMVSEQRQASDDDLSSRAFFAAESGVEDAKTALAEYMMNGGEFSSSEEQNTAESCDTFGDRFLISDSSLETEIVCQTIDTDLDDVLIDGSPAWHSVAIPMISNSDFDRFTVEWHKPQVDGSTFNHRSSDRLPTTSVWSSAQHPAAMKMTLLQKPSTGNMYRDELIESTRIVHMLPGTPGTSGVNSFDTTSSDFGLGGANSLPMIQCEGSGSIEPDGYACSAEFTGLSPSNTDYFVILTPLYRSTSIRMSLASGQDAVSISNAQAEVDVTAKAGDVFRRVRARVLLSDPSLALIPDLAVGANEVCKDFALRSDSEEFVQANSGNVLDDYCVFSP